MFSIEISTKNYIESWGQTFGTPDFDPRVRSVPASGSATLCSGRFGWIYWNYEFLFFRPRGLRTRRPAQTRPGGQNPAFQRFDPMILCSFLWRFRKTALESHSSKQMTVYKQITFFFIKNRKFSIFFLTSKSIFY